MDKFDSIKAVFPKLFELADLKTLNKMLADHKIL
jgi:hypothetical protein